MTIQDCSQKTNAGGIDRNKENCETISASQRIEQTFAKIREIITIEPLVAFYQLGLNISKPALDNLELEKACRVNLRYNDTVCDAILEGDHRNYSIENNNMQVVISKMHSWQQPIQSFAPLLLILFLGSFSDRHKWRKPFFVIPLIGDFAGNVGCLLCVINMKSWPIEVQGVFQRIVPSLLGTQILVIMSTTAYIADISTVETRTFRIGVTTVLIGAAVTVANAISGILFLKIGYEGVLTVSLTLMLFSLIYGLLYVREPQYPGRSVEVSLCADVFNPKHARDTFKILFKKTKDMDHLKLLLVLVILHRCAIEGENNVFYLYVQNVFQWTPVDYSYYLTANSTVSLIGNILGLCLLVKTLKTGDLTILFITICIRIVANITFGCATTPEVFYIGAFMSIVTKLYRIVKRSYATKIVSSDDIGKTQSLLGIAEALAPAASVPAYNLLYMHTLLKFPAAIFFFSILLYLICFLFIVWMYFKNKRNEILDNIDGQGQYKTTEVITHM